MRGLLFVIIICISFKQPILPNNSTKLPLCIIHYLHIYCITSNDQYLGIFDNGKDRFLYMNSMMNTGWTIIYITSILNYFMILI